MICGVKIVIYCAQLCKSLQQHNALHFISQIHEPTGELLNIKEATYRNLKFTIYVSSNRIEINGSLHKYFKDENHSNFTYNEISACIVDLESTFGINPNKASLSNLEFGVNLTTPFNPFDFCNSIISYKGNAFAQMRANSNSHAIGFNCQMAQYRIKIYDKGKQYKKHKNILRFEIRATRMAFLKKAKITTLSDLTNKEVYTSLLCVLLDCFTHLIIDDNTVVRNKLTAHEERIYFKYLTPKTWAEISPRERYKRKQQFNKITHKYGTRNWGAQTQQMIKDKWQCLLGQ